MGKYFKEFLQMLDETDGAAKLEYWQILADKFFSINAAEKSIFMFSQSKPGRQHAQTHIRFQSKNPDLLKNILSGLVSAGKSRVQGASETSEAGFDEIKVDEYLGISATTDDIETTSSEFTIMILFPGLQPKILNSIISTEEE